MDKLRAAAADVAERVVRSRPVLWLRGVLDPQRDTDRTQQGQGLAEYALILAGIAIVAIASLAIVGSTITDLFWAPINEDFAEVLSRIGL